MIKPEPLLDLLRSLEARDYDFITPTPATHARVIARRTTAKDLRDVFGWSLPFDTLEPSILALMEAAGIVERHPLGRRSTLRVSRLHGRLFLHSAYPTTAEDAVFFGPDSYRFADFIVGEGGQASHVVDIGAGAGVGALATAEVSPRVRLTLTDVNPLALALARVNAAFAGREVETVQCEGLNGVKGDIDLILANPPYMNDDGDRAYRDGGGGLGGSLSVEWATQAVARLKPGGRMLLYSGSAIVDGHDALKAALAQIKGASLAYREIDPDVFGEELDEPAYAQVERIAAIGAVLTKT